LPLLYAALALITAHAYRFETVTVVLQGEFQHRDSTGNSGLLRAGDVQWMTAGSGIIHDESPSPALLKTGGVVEGFQVAQLARHLSV
jgi:redox-sensitive bicupin YhaK (pirin superfamily)